MGQSIILSKTQVATLMRLSEQLDTLKFKDDDFVKQGLVLGASIVVKSLILGDDYNEIIKRLVG